MEGNALRPVFDRPGAVNRFQVRCIPRNLHGGRMLWEMGVQRSLEKLEALCWEACIVRSPCPSPPAVGTVGGCSNAMKVRCSAKQPPPTSVHSGSIPKEPRAQSLEHGRCSDAFNVECPADIGDRNMPSRFGVEGFVRDHRHSLHAAEGDEPTIRTACEIIGCSSSVVPAVLYPPHHSCVQFHDIEVFGFPNHMLRVAPNPVHQPIRMQQFRLHGADEHQTA